MTKDVKKSSYGIKSTMQCNKGPASEFLTHDLIVVKVEVTSEGNKAIFIKNIAGNFMYSFLLSYLCIDPPGQSKVTASSDNYFQTCRPYICTHYTYQ